MFPALTGQRKQSEMWKSFFHVIWKDLWKGKPMCMKQFISRIRNWGWACDDRGLTELQQCKFNYESLEMILEKLMPWYKEQYDFSLLEETNR